MKENQERSLTPDEASRFNPSTMTLANLPSLEKPNDILMQTNLKSILIKRIKTKPLTAIPESVTSACKLLQTRGFKAYLAGGCVRDMSLGRKPRDWDIVTSAPLAEIQKLFPEHIDVGVAFGIVKLKTREGEPGIDIAIFRKESGYSDLRHPDTVDIGDETTDILRRDFTVNAMYFDLETSEILDGVGGMKDLQSKTLRAVGVATERFKEDALRMLRVLRFSAQLGFKIEPETFTAVKKYALLLREISRERVREETFRILSSSRPVLGLESMMKAGLWELVFGMKKSSLPADFRTLKFQESPKPLDWICALGVTGLLGDPMTEAEKITARVTEKLRLSNQEKKTFAQVLRVFEDAPSKTAKVAGSPLDWIDLARADKPCLELAKRFIRRARGVTVEEKENAIKLVDQSIRWASKKDAVKQLPTSAELIKEGYSEGPKLGIELKRRQWERFWGQV